MCEKLRVNVKVKPRFTFTFTRGFSYIVSILFTHVKPVKVYARKHVKITPPSTLRSCDTNRPHSNFFLATNKYIFGRKNPFALPPKDCALLHVDFDETTVFRSNSEAMRY